ncbi:hypothetical protein [Pseudomonas sp. Irchel 3E13]|uniref:hypothetical protein n=1 Tax=Pseudomonas sp. Irchel 3E13 TaxID=2008975 RepID=UPI000BA49576|nr:hypothetical protein [Pseudomonas sp. Irchel 3E13]
MTISTEPHNPAFRARVAWRLSYHGKQEYDCFFEGSEFRVTVRASREAYPAHCNMSELDFERWENGQLGYVTHGESSKLTKEFVATFNRLRFDDWHKQVKTMLSQPEKYAGHIPEHFHVYVGAAYDRTKGWVRLHDFAEIRALAGIPEDCAIDPTVVH